MVFLFPLPLQGGRVGEGVGSRKAAEHDIGASVFSGMSETCPTPPPGFVPTPPFQGEGRERTN